MSSEEIIRVNSGNVQPGEVWLPAVGVETRGYLDAKPDDMRDRLQAEGLRVLGRCVHPMTPPGPATRRAGLVLGYVQSGKTSSFTTVTALARDNGYQLVIVIAGTTTILQDQTANRLRDDLDLGRLDAHQRWALLKNPTTENDEGQSLRNLLAQHADPTADRSDLGVPLVVVMKQHSHLANLIALLEEIPALEHIAALVIDDEAHMHSMNVARGDLESTTYAKLKSLRKFLPLHTLLQYTATPQAPLLAHVADEISPDFICLLEPGADYTGGSYFFLDHHDRFVQSIDDSESYALDAQEFKDHGPPPSLRQAFLTYLLTCALSRLRGEQDPPQSSMLVHPHSRVDVHQVWLESIEEMKLDVQRILSEADSDVDRREFISGELDVALELLRSPDDELPTVEELVPHIKTVLARVQIKSINSRASSDVPWHMAQYWILVGGNLLGVGLTVEGLRTTHMMRTTGGRLVDSIQQRARFFGYKARYASTCRAWMQPDLDHAFVDYVKHEKVLRQSLEEFDADLRPLREWKRVFLLDPRFRPTRKAAQRITLAGFQLERGWWSQKSFLAEELDDLSSNRRPVDEFLGGRSFEPAPSISGATSATAHSIAGCSLAELRELLAGFFVSSNDTAKLIALNLLLAAAEDEVRDGPEACAVVSIAAGHLPRRRERGIAWFGDDPRDREVGSVTLHQGRNPGEGEPRYAGDAKACDEDRITLQIHRLDLRDGAHGPLFEGASDLPFVAVYLPERLRSGVAHEL